MEISYELLNRFARIIVGKDSDKKVDANINLYGTIRVDPETEEKQVLIDGCDSPTPIYEAMDAINGDRVLVTIKDHKAVITGNLTAPASARNASGFLKPIPTGGFIIGEIKDGDPIVAYIILKETEILFLSFEGKVMGSFSTKNTRLGHDKDSTIRLCGDTGNIKYTDDEGFIFDAKDYIEIDTKSGDHNAKIINSSKNGDPYISMELHNANTGKDASVKLTSDGFDIWIPDYTKATVNGLPFIQTTDEKLVKKINEMTKAKSISIDNDFITANFYRLGPTILCDIRNIKKLTYNTLVTVITKTELGEDFLPFGQAYFLLGAPGDKPQIRGVIDMNYGIRMFLYASTVPVNITDSFTYLSYEYYKNMTE